MIHQCLRNKSVIYLFGKKWPWLFPFMTTSSDGTQMRGIRVSLRMTINWQRSLLEEPSEFGELSRSHVSALQNGTRNVEFSAFTRRAYSTASITDQKSFDKSRHRSRYAVFEENRPKISERGDGMGSVAESAIQPEAGLDRTPSCRLQDVSTGPGAALEHAASLGAEVYRETYIWDCIPIPFALYRIALKQASWPEDNKPLGSTDVPLLSREVARKCGV